jgi:hypothetical protein
MEGKADLTQKRDNSGYLLHFVGYADKPQEHVERCPQRSNILRFNMQDQGTRPLDPAVRRGPRIHLVLQLREERPVDQIRMIGHKPEQGFMLRHRRTSYRIWEKQE